MHSNIPLIRVIRPDIHKNKNHPKSITPKNFRPKGPHVKHIILSQFKRLDPTLKTEVVNTLITQKRNSELSDILKSCTTELKLAQNRKEAIKGMTSTGTHHVESQIKTFRSLIQTISTYFEQQS